MIENTSLEELCTRSEGGTPQVADGTTKSTHLAYQGVDYQRDDGYLNVRTVPPRTRPAKLTMADLANDCQVIRTPKAARDIPRASKGGSIGTTLAAPSLLDPHSTGGIHAGDGFTVQDRYLALLVPGWLADPSFVRFQPERNDDIDVWFSDGRDHHQVKNESLTIGEVRSLIKAFTAWNGKLIAEKRIRRYVIVCAYLTSQVRSFAKSLDIVRSRCCPAGDEDEHASTVQTLRDRADRLRLGDQLDFILEHVYFEQNLAAALEAPGSDLVARIAVRLMPHIDVVRLDEGIASADGLLRALAEDRKREWSAEALRALVRRVRRAYLEGPPRAAGDLLLVCHETLKRIAIAPDSTDHSVLFGDRRVVRVPLDGVDRMTSLDVDAIQSVALDLAAPGGRYLAALGAPDSRVLYYGFPHVPFAALAGFLAQGHRHISLVEQDRDTGRFVWRPDALVTTPATHLTEHLAGTSAQIRVSVSAYVREEACGSVLPTDDVRFDLHVEAEDVGRGVVGTEAQAREYALRLRRAVDKHINGNPGVTSLHVFAAVPVSVAFLIGQVLAHSGLPRCYVYNFDATATPRYCWRLCLHDAVAGKPCVQVMGRK